MKHTRRFFAMFLSLVCVLALAACGGGGKDGGTVEAPDLNQYYEDFMATLGEDNPPAMMDLEAEQIASYYPGLETYGAKQLVLKAAAITAVPYEFALVELADEANAQAVADIFQARIDAQVEGGAFYPMTVEAWEKAQVITHGSVVALICAGEEQSDAAAAFEKLFA